jgi:hypothetical protein
VMGNTEEKDSIIFSFNILFILYKYIMRNEVSL